MDTIAKRDSPQQTRKYGQALIVIALVMFWPGIKWAFWSLYANHAAECNGSQFTFPITWYVEHRDHDIVATKACFTVFCFPNAAVTVIKNSPREFGEKIWFNSTRKVGADAGYSLSEVRTIGPASCIEGNKSEGPKPTFVSCIDSIDGLIAAYEGNLSGREGFYETLRTAKRVP